MTREHTVNSTGGSTRNEAQISSVCNEQEIQTGFAFCLGSLHTRTHICVCVCVWKSVSARLKVSHERGLINDRIRIDVDHLGVTHSAGDISPVRARGKYEKCISSGYHAANYSMESACALGCLNLPSLPILLRSVVLHVHLHVEINFENQTFKRSFRICFPSYRAIFIKFIKLTP